MADWLVKLLMVEYALIAGVYAWQRDWARMLYFLSATGISLAVLRMK